MAGPNLVSPAKPGQDEVSRAISLFIRPQNFPRTALRMRGGGNEKARRCLARLSPPFPPPRGAVREGAASAERRMRLLQRPKFSPSLVRERGKNAGSSFCV